MAMTRREIDPTWEVVGQVAPKRLARSDAVGVMAKASEDGLSVWVVHPDGNVLRMSTSPKGLVDDGPVVSIWTTVKRRRRYKILKKDQELFLPDFPARAARPVVSILPYHGKIVINGETYVSNYEWIKKKGEDDDEELEEVNFFQWRPEKNGSLGIFPKGSIVYGFTDAGEPDYEMAGEGGIENPEDQEAALAAFDLLVASKGALPPATGWPVARAALPFEQAVERLNPVKMIGAQPLGTDIPKWLGKSVQAGKSCLFDAAAGRAALTDSRGVILACGKELHASFKKNFTPGDDVPAGVQVFKPDLQDWGPAWLLKNSKVVGGVQLFPTITPVFQDFEIPEKPVKSVGDWAIYAPAPTLQAHGKTWLVSEWTTSDVTV